ncbi:MAG: hypothetical protein ABI977_06425 [Acidobacteriota bacterium]
MKTDVDNQAGQTDQARLMRRYLLGALPESEQVALEQQFFADGETLDCVWAVENELVDGYVRGQLSRAERQQFEQHYLQSPGHRERVAFARTLLPMTSETPVPARSAEATESFWEKLSAMLRTPQFALSAALVVAFILIGGAWLVNERARWQQQLAQSQAEHNAKELRARELESQIAQQRERNSQLSAELEQLRAEQIRASASPSPPSRSTVFSFFLLPSVRAGSEQQTLKPPPDATRIRLQTKIERRDYHRYQASVRAVDGGESWQATSVKATAAKDATTVSVLIPAAKLKRGDYILTLTGIDATGTAEEIDRYFFRIGN